MDVFSHEMPMELVTELLARLPVKSLVRFMCVCKAWCSLISSPEFASMHLDCYHNNNDEKPLLTASIEEVGKFQWMLISSLTYKKIVHDDYTILNNQTIMADVDNCVPRGSSADGLLLLSKRSIDPSDHQSQLELLLWNPLIGKTRELPACNIDPEASLGFGFSHSRNDYLVVAISRLPNTSVDVFSLSTGNWNSIVGYKEDIIKEVLGDGCLVVDGVMHFVSVNFFERSSHMVMFDMNDEMFTYVKLPCLASDSYPVVYRDKVGLLDFDCEDYRCNLWVMGKDGKPDSWRKLYTINVSPRLAPQMLVFKENGEFLVCLKEGKVASYNLESKKVKGLRLRPSCVMGDCFPYKQSLLLLN